MSRERMCYGSVCSGIEAATVAWDHPLRWQPAFFAEVATFPSQVLAHHHPHVPNAGDFTRIQNGDYAAIDLLVGGTPCQDFSVAGLRAGMEGARGQLTVEFAHLAGRLRPRWLVWENVPGVLSIDGGRAFGTFLGMLGQLGYGVAYRVLDAQHFGVPQRRRRVFVVGHRGDWRCAAAVLFERHSLSWDTPPRRQAGQGATCDVAPCLGASGRGFERTGDTRGQDCLVASDTELRVSELQGAERGDVVSDVRVVRPRAIARVIASLELGNQGSGGNIGWHPPHRAARTLDTGGPPGIVLASTGNIAHCLNAGGMGRQDYETETLITHALRAVAMNLRGRDGGSMPELSDVASLRAADGGSSRSYIAGGMAVRRLTPRECERLQGFPDDYTKLSDKTADGPRYKALGNSMAVPVMRWIGERIEQVRPGGAAGACSPCCGARPTGQRNRDTA